MSTPSVAPLETGNRAVLITSAVARLLRRAEELAMNQHLAPDRTVVCLNRLEVEGVDLPWDRAGRSMLWSTIADCTGVSETEIDRFFETARLGTFRKIKDIQSGLALYGSPHRELAFACYDYDHPHHRRFQS